MSTTWPSPCSPVTKPAIGRPGVNGEPCSTLVTSSCRKPKGSTKAPSSTMMPAASSARDRLVEVVDLPAEVGQLVPLPRVDHDPVRGVVDAEPHGAVGPVGRQLGAEHLGPERPPRLGVRRPEPDVGEVLDHGPLVSVVIATVNVGRRTLGPPHVHPDRARRRSGARSAPTPASSPSSTTRPSTSSPPSRWRWPTASSSPRRSVATPSTSSGSSRRSPPPSSAPPITSRLEVAGPRGRRAVELEG